LKELARVEGERIAGVRGVTDEQYKLYRLHRDVIAEFSKGYELLNLVLEEHHQFQQGLVDVGHAIASEPDLINQNNVRVLTFKTSRLMLSFLSSVRTFLEHAQTSISRQYGKASEQVLYFKALTAHQFDNVFSYRFLYKLRNYTQHCGMPPVNFSVNIVPGVDLELQLVFMREILVEEYAEWGAVLKRELESGTEPLYVFSLLKEHRDSIVGIYLGFYEKYDSQAVGVSRRWMCDFLSDSHPDDKYCFLEIGDSPADSKEKSFRLEWIPTSMVREVLWVEERLHETLSGGMKSNR
jgi:hypothetical protein